MKICFVCSGNACRSPFAETVMKKMLADKGIKNVGVCSVGTLNWRKRSIPTHSGWLYPLTFDAGKGLKED